MLETGNNIQNSRLTFRFSRNTLSFSAIDRQAIGQIKFQPFIVKSGISMAANLREAFKEDNMLQDGYGRAQVLTDTPILLIPVEQFKDENKALLYHHAFPGHENDAILHTVLPDLNAVAVFSINKDLKLVLTDHFNDIRFLSTVFPVWKHLHKRSFTGVHNKLYGYFHDKQLDIFSFDKNRFKFSNTFKVNNAKDAVYFLLYVWKQLNLDVHHDELHLAGDVKEKEELLNTLKQYIRNVYIINPSAEFNRAPITQIKGLPFDLLTLYAK